MNDVKQFFGMMFQGSSIDLDGRIQDPYYPLPIGVQRLWDTRAAMTFFGPSQPFNLDGLESQVRFAERERLKVLYCFGFSGDVNFPPPPEVLVTGSKNKPWTQYLDEVVDAVLDYSLLGVEKPKIDLYEEWNEPAIASLYWDDPPTISARTMYGQSGRMYDKIKSRDPRSLVLSPSLNDLLEPSGLAFAMRYGELMREYSPKCDGVAYHMYCNSLDDARAQLANLESACRSLEHLGFYCTEFKGPFEVMDELYKRGHKLVVWNGQIPPSPYADAALAQKWKETYDRISHLPTTTVQKQPSGCKWNPFR